jgi:type IV pilus assembly protein PilC
MPTYQYTARDERGNAVTGTLAAPNAEALADQLKRTGYLVTRSRELAASVSLGTAVQRLRGVGADDFVMFTVQLAKMVQVGIPLVTALDTLTEQTDNPRLRQAVVDVARSVQGGSSFSEAMERHPAVFSRLFVNMVRAGEVSGKLDDILRRMAVFAKRQAELRQQLMTALTYPAILFVVGVAVTGFLVGGIIPRFMKIFLEAGVPLPLPTRLIQQASQLVIRHWLAGVAALVASGIALRAWALTAAGRRRLDAMLLRVPVLGELIRKAVISQMAWTLESLFSSGVPVLESLEITEQTCGNTVIADVCRTAQTSVRQGGSLSESLRVSRQFPPMVAQMVTVGEASGTLSQMLAEIANHYDELVQHQLKRLTAVIEPAFLLIMGGLVAFIMASILLPLFRMMNVVH